MPTENDVERAALLPCPFCGGENVTACSTYVMCHSCGAEGPWDERADDSFDPIAAWNARAAIAAMPERGVDSIWRNGITNTAILIDKVRSRHAKALRRNKAFAAFDADLNQGLQAWFDATRAAAPQSYEEAEQVWLSFPPPHAPGAIVMTPDEAAAAERERVVRSSDNCPFWPACYVVGDCGVDDWKRDNCGLPEPEKSIARKAFWDGLFATAIARNDHTGDPHDR